MLKERQ
jgi:hypothetical protein